MRWRSSLRARTGRSLDLGVLELALQLLVLRHLAHLQTRLSEVQQSGSDHMLVAEANCQNNTQSYVHEDRGNLTAFMKSSSMT